MKTITSVLLMISIIILSITLLNINDYFSEKRERELTDKQHTAMIAKKNQEMQDKFDSCQKTEENKISNTVSIAIIIAFIIVIIIGLIQSAFVDYSKGFSKIAIGVTVLVIFFTVILYQKNECEKASIYLRQQHIID